MGKQEKSRSLGLFLPPLHFFLPLVLAIGGALHVENLGFIDEPVDDGVGDRIIGKDLIEFSKGYIRGGDRT